MTSLGGRASSQPAARRVAERGIGVAAALVREPGEALERVREQIAERREQQQEIPRYVPDAHWPATLKEALGEGAEDGANADAEFDDVWRDVEGSFAELNLPFGRAAFGGWDDGDAALARATWWIVRRLRPTIVVETGVGRGATTRVILEALARNGKGHLWSIDVPPLLRPALADQTAAIVPASYMKHWTFVRGSSRRRLSGLLAHVRYVDVLLHDSFHTARNLLFEWETTFPRLRRPGVLIADDVHRNAALAQFTRAHPTLERIVCSHEDGMGLFAVLVARN